MNKAFSLIELSIVLVILGLLTGGILAGQSLIRAAELRAVSVEYSRYITAAQTFRDKYFGVPGDFRDATRFWNRQLGTADCVTNSSAATNAAGVCDGNGDGVLNTPAASQSGEIHQTWRHLALAGLVEGTYTGLAGSGAGNHVTNDAAPRSKLNNAYWVTRTFGTGTFAGTSGDLYALSYGNTLQFGGLTASSDNATSVLKPEEAWNIDSKMDDGMPGTGKVVTRGYNGCTNSTSVTDTSKTYRLDSTALACTPIFREAF